MLIPYLILYRLSKLFSCLFARKYITFKAIVLFFITVSYGAIATTLTSYSGFTSTTGTLTLAILKGMA